MFDFCSDRLRFEPVSPANAKALHRLAVDPFVRRYLMDGEIVPPAWADAEVERAQGLYRETGLGLYLLHHREAETDAAIGFAGFRVFEDIGPEPQLLYALLETATGDGLATESGRTLLDRSVAAGHRRAYAAVDDPNTASIRVLDRLGFEESGRLPGPFGETITFQWRAGGRERR